MANALNNALGPNLFPFRSIWPPLAIEQIPRLPNKSALDMCERMIPTPISYSSPNNARRTANVHNYESTDAPTFNIYICPRPASSRDNRATLREPKLRSCPLQHISYLKLHSFLSLKAYNSYIHIHIVFFFTFRSVSISFDLDLDPSQVFHICVICSQYQYADSFGWNPTFSLNAVSSSKRVKPDFNQQSSTAIVC